MATKIDIKPWKITIKTNEDGTYTINTNNFVMQNVSHENAGWAMIPFIGANGFMEIHAETEEQFNYFESLISKNRRVAGYDLEMPGFVYSYLYNLSNQRTKCEIVALKNCLKGKRVLFCGAGPSLDENWDIIKEIIEKDKAFVVTGGTGIVNFYKHGISPHLCIALDPFDQEFLRFEPLSKKWMKSTVLLASAGLNARCYDYWAGPLVAAEGLNYSTLGELVEGDIITIEEGTVGVSTWMPCIAEYLGAKELYYIGVDLKYYENGDTYADNLNFEKFDHIKKDVKRDGVATRQNWINETEDLADRALVVPFPCYNCSQKGLDIPGWIKVELNTLLRKRKQTNFVPLRKWSKGRHSILANRLRTFKQELRYWVRHFYTEEFLETDIYLKLIKPYDVVQEYYNWRSGRYNFELIKGVMRSIIEVIEDIEEDPEYKGEIFRKPNGTLREAAKLQKTDDWHYNINTKSRRGLKSE